MSEVVITCAACGKSESIDSQHPPESWSWCTVDVGRPDEDGVLTMVALYFCDNTCWRAWLGGAHKQGKTTSENGQMPLGGRLPYLSDTGPEWFVHPDMERLLPKWERLENDRRLKEEQMSSIEQRIADLERAVRYLCYTRPAVDSFNSDINDALAIDRAVRRIPPSDATAAEALRKLDEQATRVAQAVEMPLGPSQPVDRNGTPLRVGDEVTQLGDGGSSAIIRSFTPGGRIIASDDAGYLTGNWSAENVVLWRRAGEEER